ncbi:MAG: hypothetical protein WDW36_005255 [Sanguina aurantia]
MDSGTPTPRRAPTNAEFGGPGRHTTDTLMALNVMCFALQWLTKDKLTYLGWKVNALITAGQVWRLLTPAFLHASITHLGFNMYALHNLGPQLEVLSGGPRFTAIYLTSAVVSCGASYLFCKAPSLGASGAIFGLGAALGIFYWRHRDILGEQSGRALKSLGITLAMNIAFSLVGRNLDNWGHAGGMLGGAVLALLLGPRFLRQPDGSIVDKPPVSLLSHRTVRPAPTQAPQKQQRTQHSPGQTAATHKGSKKPAPGTGVDSPPL